MLVASRCEGAGRKSGNGGMVTKYAEVFERKEVKYRLSPFQYQSMRAALEPYMAPDGYGRTSVTSVYYDTPERSLIARSLEKPPYKEKVRLRSYGPRKPGQCVFIELKKKYDGIVYKRRVGVSREAAQAFMAGVPYARACERFPLDDARLQQDALLPRGRQIAAEVSACVKRNGPLAPSICIMCERTAWAPIDGLESTPGYDDFSAVRITFDERLRYRDLFSDGSAQAVSLLPFGEAIMEVKSTGPFPLVLVRALDRCGAYPTSFSKYGAAYLDCNHAWSA